jgi:hypothetical protein
VLSPYGSIKLYFATEDHGIRIKRQSRTLTEIPGFIFGLSGAVELNHFFPGADLALRIHVSVIWRQVLLKPGCITLHRSNAELAFQMLDGLGNLLRGRHNGTRTAPFADSLAVKKNQRGQQKRNQDADFGFH